MSVHRKLVPSVALTRSLPADVASYAFSNLSRYNVDFWELVYDIVTGNGANDVITAYLLLNGAATNIGWSNSLSPTGDANGFWLGGSGNAARVQICGRISVGARAGLRRYLQVRPAAILSTPGLDNNVDTVGYWYSTAALDTITVSADSGKVLKAGTLLMLRGFRGTRL